ncbi:MAG TPA: hypothetical protein VD994_12275 [Prosthecobacter sp.]|nr:hypothetical protein [Prosthecobacter sp.]
MTPELEQDITETVKDRLFAAAARYAEAKRRHEEARGKGYSVELETALAADRARWELLQIAGGGPDDAAYPLLHLIAETAPR